MSKNINHEAQMSAIISQRKAETKQAHDNFVNKSIDKQREKSASMEKERLEKEALEKESFFYETDTQKAIRLRMQQIGDSVDSLNSSSSYVENREEKVKNLLEEYRELKQEYISIPYNIGKETFKEILHYETANGDEQLISKDGGLTWSLYQYGGNGLMVKSNRKVIVENGIPKTISGTYTTDYIKRYFNGLEMPTTTNIELLESNIPFPEKVNAVPQQRLNFGWFCAYCHEQNKDDTAKECSFCHAKRKY